MAYLFIEAWRSDQGEPGWQAIRLDARSPFPLDGPAGEAQPAREAGGREPAATPNEASTAPSSGASPTVPGDSPTALVAGSASGRTPTWALLASRSSEVAVNGSPVLLGICVLKHRDRIVADCGGQLRTFYFSSEKPAAIEPFPGPEPVVCPRCKSPISPGEPAVCCPACGFWHHEIRDGEEQELKTNRRSAGEPAWKIRPSPTLALAPLSSSASDRAGPT